MKISNAPQSHRQKPRRETLLGTSVLKHSAENKDPTDDKNMVLCITILGRQVNYIVLVKMK